MAQKDTAIKFWGIENVNNASKDQLYQRGRAWFNSSFKSSKDVLQIQDKETGELAGKGNLEATSSYYFFGKKTVIYPISFSVNL